MTNNRERGERGREKKKLQYINLRGKQDEGEETGGVRRGVGRLWGRGRGRAGEEYRR